MSHTPGPWTVCNKGDCTCKVVWCSEHPIAEVVHGPWGDRYPALRLIGDSLDIKAEPFIDMIEYGAVDEDTAKDNALLIASAPDLLEALELAVATSYEAGMSGEDDEGWLSVARAAIKKARGE